MLTSDAALADQGLVRLSYLENDNTVKKGDMIVTSGIGGIFPKNLLIGKAVEVQSSQTDVSLYATVEPYVDVKNVKDVLIITDFAGQGIALILTAAGREPAHEARNTPETPDGNCICIRDFCTVSSSEIRLRFCRSSAAQSLH